MLKRLSVLAAVAFSVTSLFAIGEPEPVVKMPDAGSTLLLLGLGTAVGAAVWRRR